MIMVWDERRVAPATARFLELTRATAKRYERAYGRLARASYYQNRCHATLRKHPSIPQERRSQLLFQSRYLTG